MALLARCAEWHLLLHVALHAREVSHALELIRTSPRARWLRAPITANAADAGDDAGAPFVGRRRDAPPVLAPRHWAALLAAVGDSGLADGRMLFRLAFRPGGEGGEGGGGGAARVMALDGAREGALLEVFARRWASAGWPAHALAVELHVAIHPAGGALRWMIEHRPDALRDLPLPPRVLLGAIGPLVSPAPPELPAAVDECIDALERRPPRH